MSELIDRGDVLGVVSCFFKDNDIDGLADLEREINRLSTASPWHRVEEPPKDACDCLVCWTTIHDEETGEVTGHGFWCEKGWYEDGLLGEVGFYCQRREETHPVRVEPDYWMPIEPPKEEE